MDKLNHLKFILQRIDHYYNGVNLKGTFFLGVNTFILGGCLASFQSDGVVNTYDIWLLLSFLLVVLLSLISVAFVLWAILPFLNHGKSYDYESIIFFGSIANRSFKQFHQEVEQISTDSFEKDITRQIHILSAGLQSKYIRIRNAGVFLFLSLTSTIPFFYQILQSKP